MNIRKFFKWDLSISHFMNLRKYKKQFRLDHPNFFEVDGIIIFTGLQGQGKSLSAVKYVKAMKKAYPRALVVSNMHIMGIDYIKYKGIESLTDINNGEEGVIYLIDEIHLEWNSLESKSIPIEVFTEISQQRKQRKHIVGTSQLFTRVAKPFREQVKWVVLCKCVWGYLQYNILTNGETITTDMKGELVYKPLKRSIFWHTVEMYNAYDTFEKVQRYKEMDFKANTDIYEKGEPMFFYRDERRRK